MGRFLRSGPSDRALRAAVPTAVVVEPVSPAGQAFRPNPPEPAPAPVRPAPMVAAEPRVGMLNTIGRWAFAAALLSTPANDLMMHLAGGKAYLFKIGYPIAVFAFLFCGTTLRGLQDKAGRLWLFLGLWMIVCVPFSIWRGGSIDVLEGYFPRAHLFFFIICAFAVRVRDCRFILNACIGSGFLLLLTCVLYGGVPEQTGRFCIPLSNYFENPNDLALWLVVSLAFFGFMVGRPQIIYRIIGALAIGLTFYYILKAASRGTMVACVAIFITLLIVSKARLKLMLLLIPLLGVIPLMPSGVLHRITLIVSNAQAETATASNQDAGSIGSQAERQQLFRMSVNIALTHPIFGVGPGQFVEATEGANRRKGIHSAALGTHNAFTQIASECGLPAFIAMVGAVIVSLRRVKAVYRATTGNPKFAEISAMALTLLTALVGLSVNAIFHHCAYEPLFSMVLGLCVALYLSAKPLLVNRTAAARPLL